MVDIIVTSVAEMDYTEALCWYAEHSIQAAEGFDAELDRALMAIAADPQRFPLCDDRHRFFLMRRYPYQVIYREQTNHVAVIAIAHVKRDPAFWSNR